MIMNFKHNHLQTKYGNSLREETKTQCLLHLLSQTPSLITHDYFPVSALFISFSTMAQLTMELGKTPILAEPIAWYEMWVWTPGARKLRIRGSRRSELAHHRVITCKRQHLVSPFFPLKKLPARRASWEPCRMHAGRQTEARPYVVRQMWWEFRCLNSPYEKRNFPFLSHLIYDVCTLFSGREKGKYILKAKQLDAALLHA